MATIQQKLLKMGLKSLIFGKFDEEIQIKPF